MNSEVEVRRLREQVAALKYRNELLEGQVIALSRAPAILSAVVKELQADNRALRIGAKRRFTEAQLRERGDWNTTARSKAGLDEPEPTPGAEELVDDVGEAS